MAAICVNILPGMGKKTLQGYEAWLRKRGRERSVEVYANFVGHFLDNPQKAVKRLTDSSYSPNTRRFFAAALKSWAHYAGDKKLSQHLSDIRMPAPAPKAQREPFDKETWFELQDEIRNADYLKPSIRCVCLIIAIRGIRCGDILRARHSELVQATKTKTLSFEAKGEKRLEYRATSFLPVIEELVEIAEDHRWRWPREDFPVRYLVCKSGKQRTASCAVQRAFDQIAESFGLPPAEVYAHRFRHTYATHYLQAMQGDPEAVFKLKDQMGWSRLETAANYLRRSRRDELDDIESELLKR